jgi:hypothetical protein
MMPPGRAGSVAFEGGGHWLYMEQPAEFADVVTGFATGGLDGVAGWGGRVPPAESV